MRVNLRVRSGDEDKRLTGIGVSARIAGAVTVPRMTGNVLLIHPGFRGVHPAQLTIPPPVGPLLSKQLIATLRGFRLYVHPKSIPGDNSVRELGG